LLSVASIPAPNSWCRCPAIKRYDFRPEVDSPACLKIPALQEARMSKRLSKHAYIFPKAGTVRSTFS
jgi:hypothetical protein